MKKKNRRDRILLPGGYSMSQPSIHPANWKQVSAATKIDWYISYRLAKTKQVYWILLKPCS